MLELQRGLDGRLRYYGTGSLLTTVLGVVCAFLSVEMSDTQGLFAFGLMSLIFALAGTVLGMYCWRLLYLVRWRDASRLSLALAALASMVPLLFASEILALR